MVVANEAAGDIEKQLDMHALRKLWTLIQRRATLLVKSMVVGKACGERRAGAVETGK